MFVDTKTKDTTTVGLVPDSCPLLIRKKKKHTKLFQIPGASLSTAQCVVEFLQGRGLRPQLSLDEIKEVYAAAKEIGSEELVNACVARVWDLRETWLRPGVHDLETECPWVYTLL